MADATQRRRTRDNELIDTAEAVTIGMGRIGYGLLSWGLGLLPRESRGHMHNAIHELTHAFVALPREFAEVTRVEIDRWAAEDGEATQRVQHVTVTGVESEGSAATGPVRTASAPASATPTAVPTSAAPAPTSAAPASPAGPAAPVTPSLPTAGATPARPAAPSAAAPATAPAAGTAAVNRAATTPPASVDASTTGGIEVAHIEFNPAGRDVEGEYVLLRNRSAAPVSLTGWTLSDGKAKHTFTFPTFTLAPGAEVRIWTRAGKHDTGNLFWGVRSAIWNNEGDTATLKDALGNLVTRYAYAPKKG